MRVVARTTAARPAVYPNSAAQSVGTMNCAHEGGDNCADHGPGIADLAQAVVPSVYGGHDHIMDGPGGVDWPRPPLRFGTPLAVDASGGGLLPCELLPLTLLVI
jgi:hypothetical protein